LISDREERMGHGSGWLFGLIPVPRCVSEKGKSHISQASLDSGIHAVQSAFPNAGGSGGALDEGIIVPASGI
jgi:hypothetical protein